MDEQVVEAVHPIRPTVPPRRLTAGAVAGILSMLAWVAGLAMMPTDAHLSDGDAPTAAVIAASRHELLVAVQLGATGSVLLLVLLGRAGLGGAGGRAGRPGVAGRTGRRRAYPGGGGHGRLAFPRVRRVRAALRGHDLRRRGRCAPRPPGPPWVTALGLISLSPWCSSSARDR